MTATTAHGAGSSWDNRGTRSSGPTLYRIGMTTDLTEQDIIMGRGEKRLFHAITDCGAGGLSSAVGEMGARLGARVDLDKVPLKYENTGAASFAAGGVRVVPNAVVRRGSFIAPNAILMPFFTEESPPKTNRNSELPLSGTSRMA